MLYGILRISFRITCIHLPFQSKWLYVGSERGNVHIVNIESFLLSGYIINWNKAIEMSVLSTTIRTLNLIIIKICTSA